MSPSPDYIAGYPAALVEQVGLLIEQNRFGQALQQKYPQAHDVRTDKALYDYVHELKRAYLRNAGPLSHVGFDNSLHAVEHALGMHTRIARVQGVKLKAKREIRVASVFKATPPEFLRMIVVHELAHIKAAGHDKEFHQLCRYMEPDYHQIEFDLRSYLVYLGRGKVPLWAAPTTASSVPTCTDSVIKRIRA